LFGFRLKRGETNGTKIVVFSFFPFLRWRIALVKSLFLRKCVDAVENFFDCISNWWLLHSKMGIQFFLKFHCSSEVEVRKFVVCTEEEMTNGDKRRKTSMQGVVRPIHTNVARRPMWTASKILSSLVVKKSSVKPASKAFFSLPLLKTRWKWRRYSESFSSLGRWISFSDVIFNQIPHNFQHDKVLFCLSRNFMLMMLSRCLPQPSFIKTLKHF
jgi:hypothetical protein